jgi:hypothetical protein
MKTIGKLFQQAGNITLIQFETLEGEGFGFRTAASAMDSGELVISEVEQEGTVNRLLAINHSGEYLLLTDMDLLKGAKQNRVVNTSVLIAPHSKQEVEVSCVERSRWSYDSPTFKTGPITLDSDMRAAKAVFLRMDLKLKEARTQSKIWGLINEKMVSFNHSSKTEDYNSLLESEKKEPGVNHQFLPGSHCNGLAVFDGTRLVSFDLFGNREVYQYYFEKLSDDALGLVRDLVGKNAFGEAEAFYRLDEFLDTFESHLEDPFETFSQRVGKFRWSGHKDYPGFELTFEGHPVHMVGFNRVTQN